MKHDELISRRQAIDALDDLCDRECEYSKKQRHVMCGACHLASAFDVVEQLPAQPEQCEDAVSRAEILRMINCINDHHAITPYKSVGAVTEHLTRIASNLPPVTPKQRTGKWIKITNTLYKCDQCGAVQLKGNYCKDCGVKMEGVAE